MSVLDLPLIQDRPWVSRIAAETLGRIVFTLVSLEGQRIAEDPFDASSKGPPADILTPRRIRAMWEQIIDDAIDDYGLSAKEAEGIRRLVAKRFVLDPRGRLGS